MQVQKIQNNQASFRGLKGFECGKNLKNIIGNAGEAIEQKLLKAFNCNESFQELCKKNDVWVDIKPKHTGLIRSGLDVEISASRLNEQNLERRENVIGYLIGKYYDREDVRIKDYSELTKNGSNLTLMKLISDYNSHTENIMQSFLKDHWGLKSAVKKFFEKSTKNM
jgi:hypothetical protein